VTTAPLPSRPKAAIVRGMVLEPPCARRAGFALLIVLWFLVLLSAVAIHIVVSGRLDTALARNIVSVAEAETLADAALVRSAFLLGDPRPKLRWPSDGSEQRLSLPAGNATIIAQDESTKINANVARPELLTALFLELGVDGAAAEEITAAMVARRSDSSRTTTSKKPHRAFDSLDELADLAGMTPSLLRKAQAHLTIYADNEEPNPVGASDIVKQAIVRSGRTVPNAPAATGAAAEPPAVIRVTIRATTNSGAQAGFTVVMALDPRKPRGGGIMWRRPLAGAT
jgi:general secretion pathway protein K